MKKSILIALLCAIVDTVNAQSTFPTDGSNVGIGTTSPARKLDILSGSGVTPLGVVGPNGYMLIDNTGAGYNYLQANVLHQFQGTSNNPIMTLLAGGNVGIGTTSPLGVLDLRGQAVFANTDFTTSTGTGMLLTRGASSGNTYTALNSYTSGVASAGNLILQNIGGNVGIGTTSPSSILQLGDFNNGAANQLVIPGTYNFEQMRLGQLGNGNMAMEFVNHTSTTPSYGIKFLVDVDHGTPGLQLQYAAPATSYSSLSYYTGLYMNLSGNIGIGTTDPGSYKLAVNGTIHSKAVIIDLIGWPDYVFKKDYQLMPLAQVKSYIDQNQHLPGLPTDKEVEAKGLDVGEMNKLLTKKVEELTLYLIDLKTQRDDEKSQLDTQNKKIEILQQQLGALITKQTNK